MRYTKTKNTFEVSNIINTIPEEAFEKITSLLDAYWTSYGAEEEAAELAEAVEVYGLTLEEITQWDAE